MKAVEISKNGGPEVLEIKDISLNKPGPDQVTIEQKAIGLNYIDTYHRSGPTFSNFKRITIGASRGSFHHNNFKYWSR
jgi:NADPH:quinone reductase-like Zn-dependent oxidoreductase